MSAPRYTITSGLGHKDPNDETKDILTERWYDEEGYPHRDNGLPAIVGEDGFEEYYNHGQFQRWTMAD